MKSTNSNRRGLRARSACGGTLAMMAATLLATGCMQEMPNEEPEQVGNAPKIFAELSEEPQTRTSIDAEIRSAPCEDERNRTLMELYEQAVLHEFGYDGEELYV